MTLTIEQKTNVEKLLESIRENFLAELPERCDDLESMVLNLASADTFSQAYDDLYRKVHSLKGSSGTHGLGMLTLISHQFEDLLSSVDQDFSKVTEPVVDTSLKYVDLLRNTAQAIQRGGQDAKVINDELESLKFSVFQGEFSCLVVEKSKMLARVTQHALSSLPVVVTVVDNGLTALERLLNEKFDILISSKELPVLNGVALASAVRYAEGINEEIYAVLLTSKSDYRSPDDGLIDVVLHKDNRLSANLLGIVREHLRGKTKRFK